MQQPHEIYLIALLWFHALTYLSTPPLSRSIEQKKHHVWFLIHSINPNQRRLLPTPTNHPISTLVLHYYTDSGRSGNLLCRDATIVPSPYDTHTTRTTTKGSNSQFFIHQMNYTRISWTVSLERRLIQHLWSNLSRYVLRTIQYKGGSIEKKGHKGVVVMNTPHLYNQHEMAIRANSIWGWPRKQVLLNLASCSKFSN